MYAVQFEEKKFLETARKIIQSSVANAQSKIESEQAQLETKFVPSAKK